MSDPKYWNLVEKIFHIMHIKYYFISFLISILLVLGYELLASNVKEFNWGYNKFDSIILSILIGFLLFGIQFFLNKMRNTFNELGNHLEDKDLSAGFKRQISKKFRESKTYYILIFLVILPFVIMQIRGYILVGNKIFFYGLEATKWAFILDIYNNILNYISLYFLATILWIIINIYWSLELLNSPLYTKNLNINIFKADKMGGLRPVKNLILSISIYYFILIVLFILSWLIPYDDGHGYRVLPYESKFLVIFWIIGVAFFFAAWYDLRKLLFAKFEDEMDRISDLCQHKTRQLSEMASKDDLTEAEKHVSEISKELDVLHKERERILNIGARPMDTKSFILFLGSAIPSCIAIIKTVDDARKMEIVKIGLNNSLDIINQLAGYLK